MTLSLASHVVCAVNIPRWHGFHNMLAVVLLARNMRPPKSAFSQHYSQHSVNTTVNTTVNTPKTLQITAFRGIYTLLGAIDLKSAYKQLASNPQDAWASILGVWDPDLCDVTYYRFATLPFGSSHSVTVFNGVASAFRKILIRLTKLVVTNVYGDFCEIEKDSLTSSATEAASLIFRMLGWKIAEEARKTLHLQRSSPFLVPASTCVGQWKAFLRLATRKLV